MALELSLFCLPITVEIDVRQGDLSDGALGLILANAGLRFILTWSKILKMQEVFEVIKCLTFYVELS